MEEDVTGAFNEEVVGDEGVVNDVLDIVEINDDGVDDGEAQAPEGLTIVPLRAIAGDPRSSVNVDQLYIAASVRDRTQR